MPEPKVEHEYWTVTACRDCPWEREQYDRKRLFCGADVDGRPTTPDAPEWCPLRRAPILVHLGGVR